VQVKLKGINRVKKKLASGGFNYHYYLKGFGAIKPLPGDETKPFRPGTTAFLRAYNALISGMVPALKVPRVTGTFRDILTDYMHASAFTQLKPRTQKDYTAHINVILDKWGTLPIEALDDVGVRPLFLKWRDERAKRSPRQADMTMTIMGTILKWALDEGRIKHNYAAKPGKTYSSNRSEMIWTQEQQDVFLAKCDASMRLPFLIAINTGQRRGDILNLTWDKVKDNRLALKQAKRGKAINLPFTEELTEAIELERQRGYKAGDDDYVLLNTQRNPWKETAFDAAWGRSMTRAGLKSTGLHFHDLRGTVVTMLSDSGASNEEIAVTLGWSRTYVERMLEIYKAVDTEASNRAIEKLERAKKKAKKTT